jgi:phospholipid/cholesterol/gamma-HCH transport system substrate-binding protein
MPRTRSLMWSELKIGIMAVVAILIAATLILSLSGQGGFFWQRYALRVRFANAGGVTEGSPVRVAGVVVGVVKTLSFVGTQVEMELDLSKEQQQRVRTTSNATIGSVSLLGQSAVDITASAAGEPIPEYGYVPTGATAPQLADVTAQASQGITQLNGLITDVRNGKGTVGKLFTDEDLYADLQQFTKAAREVTQNLQHGKGTLGELLNNADAAKQLESSLKNLSSITEKINAGQGSMGQLLNDPAFARSLTSVTSNFEDLSSKLTKGQGTAGKLMTDSALYDRLNAVTTNLEQLTTRLNQGQGTMGQLMQDKQLYDNMNKTVTELRDLLSDIRKDPKKFLTARISIF